MCIGLDLFLGGGQLDLVQGLKLPVSILAKVWDTLACKAFKAHFKGFSYRSERTINPKAFSRPFDHFENVKTVTNMLKSKVLEKPS